MDLLELFKNIYLEIGIGLISIGLLTRYYIEYKRSTGGKPLTCKYLFTLSLLLGCLPMILSLFVILFIYCQIISIILRIKHGKNFGGLLDGTDAYFAIDMDDNTKLCHNTLFIIRCSDSFQTNFGNTARNAIIKKFKETSVKTPKLWYTCQYFGGYSYFLKNQLTPEECVRVMEHKYCENGEVVDKDDFLRFISKHYSNQRFPKNHTGLFEMLIGSHPIKWKIENKNNYKYYPVLFRGHHVLSDGTAILKGVMTVFADVNSTDIANDNNGLKLGQSERKRNIFSKLLTVMCNKISYIMRGLYFLLMVPPILLVQTMIKSADNHSLCGLKMSGKKHLVCRVEETPHYVQVVKKIKNKLSDTAFSTVVITAVSASLNDFIEKYSKSVPDTISAIIPVLTKAKSLSKLIAMKHNLKKYVCQNSFSTVYLQLPTRIDSKKNTASETIFNRLELVKKEALALKNSIDYQVSLFITKYIVMILPLSLKLHLLHCLMGSTCVISILPAPPAGSVLDGYHVQDVVFWLPTSEVIGLCFSVLSYDNRLQIGLIADHAVITEEQDVRDIVDGIYKYLDVMSLESDFSKV